MAALLASQRSLKEGYTKYGLQGAPVARETNLCLGFFGDYYNFSVCIFCFEFILIWDNLT